MKKKLFIFICLLVLVCGCTSKEVREQQEQLKVEEKQKEEEKKLFEVPEELVFEANENVFELYSNVNSSELVKDTNAEITSVERTIDTDKVGKFTYTFDLEYNNNKYKQNVEYEVKDVNPPYVLTYQKTVYTLLGNKPNPCPSNNFVDDYDDVPSCEIVGEYNIYSDQDYKLQYRFYDSSNNEVFRDFTLKVVEEMPTFEKKTTTKKTTKTYIKDVINKYKTKDTMIGMDVSRYQGDIDYEKVKAAGIEFVIMRLGIQSNVGKDISVDTKYYNNIKKAKDAGLKVGVYVYTTATSNEIAREHAKWTLDILNGIELDFPIAFDWENWSKLGSYKISTYHLSEAFNTFYDTVKEAGYDAMLYSSKHYLEKVWMNRYDRPIWLAHYTSNLNKSSYAGKYIMWQLCSDGRVDGIKGAVDLDIYYKQKEE